MLGIRKINFTSALAYNKIRSLTTSKSLYGWHRLPSGFLYRTDVFLGKNRPTLQLQSCKVQLNRWLSKITPIFAPKTKQTRFSHNYNTINFLSQLCELCKSWFLLCRTYSAYYLYNILSGAYAPACNIPSLRDFCFTISTKKYYHL